MTMHPNKNVKPDPILERDYHVAWRTICACNEGRLVENEYQILLTLIALKLHRIESSLDKIASHGITVDSYEQNT